MRSFREERPKYNSSGVLFGSHLYAGRNPAERNYSKETNNLIIVFRNKCCFNLFLYKHREDHLTPAVH